MSSTEGQLLGLMLADTGDFEAALAMGVHAGLFVEEAQQRIFQAMVEAEKGGEKPTVPLLLRRLPSLAQEILSLRRDAPVAQSVEAYVQEALTQQRARDASQEILSLGKALMARKPFTPPEQIETVIARAVDRLLTGHGSTKGPKTSAEVLSELTAKMQEQMALAKAGDTSRIPTGFQVLDRVTGGGFRPGSITTVAARTGRGKTTLALNFLLTAAEAGKAACYFSVEMPNVDLMRKLVSRAGLINGTRLANADLTQDEIDRFHGAAEKLAGLPLLFHDKTGARLEVLEATCRRLRRQGRLDFVVIDYLQQYQTEKKHRSIYERVVEVSERVKRLALELDVAVLSLAQLNREAEKLDLPTAANIKESGQIEQDSDLILLIHFDERQGVSLYVDKNRDGKDKFSFPIKSDLSRSLFAEASLNLEAFG